MSIEDFERLKKNKDFCTEMWTKHEKTIRSLCEYKLSSYPDEIDDVISNVYLILCQAVASNKEFKNPKAWLLGVANTLIKKKYEEMNIEKQMFISFSENNYKLFYDIDMLDAIVSDSTLEAIRENILNGLSKEEAELYELVYEREEPKMKYRDIANIMDTSESVIKQRVFRLTKKLKSDIKYHLKKLF